MLTIIVTPSALFCASWSIKTNSVFLSLLLRKFGNSFLNICNVLTSIVCAVYVLLHSQFSYIEKCILGAFIKNMKDEYKSWIEIRIIPFLLLPLLLRLSGCGGRPVTSGTGSGAWNLPSNAKTSSLTDRGSLWAVCCLRGLLLSLLPALMFSLLSAEMSAEMCNEIIS